MNYSAAKARREKRTLGRVVKIATPEVVSRNAIVFW